MILLHKCAIPGFKPDKDLFFNNNHEFDEVNVTRVCKNKASDMLSL